MPKKHHRRDGYWRVYHRAHTRELDALVSGIVSLVKESEPPCKVKPTRRGRKPVHSPDKLVCICLLIVVLGHTFRDMENLAPKLGLPWDEPYPDHSTIHRAYESMPEAYLDAMLERTAELCIGEARWDRGTVACDSSGVETDRYHAVMRPNRKRRTFEPVRVIAYLRYHIIAILDHLIILRAKVTSESVGESPTEADAPEYTPPSRLHLQRRQRIRCGGELRARILARDETQHQAEGEQRAGGCEQEEAPPQEQGIERVRPVGLQMEGYG